MSDVLSVKIKGIDKLQAAFKKSPKLVKDTLDPAIKKALIAIQAKSTPHIPTDRGFLRNSNRIAMSILRGVLDNSSPYSTFVHEGTKPHFPPISAVEGWSKRHGISPFLVARAIAQRGTKGVPFYDKGINDAKQILDKIFNDALNTLTAKLSQ